jgi:hypothetical protein
MTTDITSDITIELAETDADAELLEQLTYGLRDELLETPVDSVALPMIGEAPEGSRALGIAAVGALVIKYAGSSDVVEKVIGVVRSWFNKNPAARTLKITVGSDVLELSAATLEQQQQLIDAFVKRSSAG